MVFNLVILGNCFVFVLDSSKLKWDKQIKQRWWSMWNKRLVHFASNKSWHANGQCAWTISFMLYNELCESTSLSKHKALHDLDPLLLNRRNCNRRLSPSRFLLLPSWAVLKLATKCFASSVVARRWFTKVRRT